MKGISESNRIIISKDKLKTGETASKIQHYTNYKYMFTNYKFSSAAELQNCRSIVAWEHFKTQIKHFGKDCDSILELLWSNELIFNDVDAENESIDEVNLPLFICKIVFIDDAIIILKIIMCF